MLVGRSPTLEAEVVVMFGLFGFFGLLSSSLLLCTNRFGRCALSLTFFRCFLSNVVNITIKMRTTIRIIQIIQIIKPHQKIQTNGGKVFCAPEYKRKDFVILSPPFKWLRYEETNICERSTSRRYEKIRFLEERRR